MKEKKEHKLLKNILIYAGFFSVIVAFMIYIFCKYNKGFIWVPDGLKQHTAILEYFRKLLVTFIKTGDLSTLTWNIGNGLNVYGNFAYYIWGDVFSYFSILVPNKYIEQFYSCMIIVRMFCIGVSFLYFSSYKKMNKGASIIGALMYTFCTFVLFTAVRHPYFLNAIILFPLIMVGVEKIVKEDKKIFYTIIVSIMFISNFYFAYMFCVLIAIYAISMIICTYKSEGIKKIILKMLQILICSIIGIMISAVILLPAGIEFINSERSGVDKIQPYTIGYYKDLAGSLLEIKSAEYWVYLGVQSIIMLSLPVFIRKRKEDYPIFILLIVLIFPLLIVQLGSAFCGFTYPNNRWTFAFAFIFAYITARFVNDDCKLEKNDCRNIISFALIFVIANLLIQGNLTTNIIVQLVIFVLILILIINKEKVKNIKIYKIAFMSLFVVGILFSEYFLYDINTNSQNYVSEFIGYNTLNDKKDSSNGKISDFKKALNYVKKIDKGFYSISKYPFDYENLSLIKNYNSSSSYFSIMPKYYNMIATDLQNVNYEMSYGFKEFDYRTKINTLLGNKYYIKYGKKNCVPYGYSKLDTYNGKSDIYVNNYVLPFGVLYTNYITDEEYSSMSSLEKESSLLKTVVLGEERSNEVEHNNNVIDTIKNQDIREISYEIIDLDNLISDDKIIIDDLEKNKIQLKINSVSNSEIYLHIQSTDFEPISKQEQIEKELPKKATKTDKKIVEEMYKDYEPDYEYRITASFNEKTATKKVKNYKTSPYYIDNDEMLANMGYYDEASGIITLEFENLGTYRLKDLKIYAVLMQDYEQDINNLRKSNFEVVEYKNGYLKGNAKVETDGILQFSTIYNKGWKVYVDGEETNTFIANKYFLGIKINQGEHIIELKYSTPYQKEGIIISIIGILALTGIIIIERLKEKSEEKYEK